MFRRKEPDYMTQEFFDDVMEMLAHGATDAEMRRKWPKQMEYCDLQREKARRKEVDFRFNVYVTLVAIMVIEIVLLLIKVVRLRILP